MSKTTSFVAALGAFGALAYLLNPLPPDAERSLAGQARISPEVVPAAAPEVAVASVSVARAPVQDATVRLVQQIQTELLRLGCYAGIVDGRWTLETQQAMHILGERVRVLRPVETPDYIMLAFARSQASHVCTAHDRATAAARLPAAHIVPTAAPLQKADRTPGQSQPQRSSERSRTAASGASRDRTGRHVGSTGVDTRSAERAASDSNNDVDVLPRDGRLLAESRMGLGAAPVDPLRAGIDPRDPSAPAILRGPAPPTPGAGMAELAVAPTAGRAERGPRPATTARRVDWKRNVFIQMRESGP